jgi:hypothetical protein
MPGAYLPFPVDSSIAMGTSNDDDDDQCDECDECDDDTFLLEASGSQLWQSDLLSRYTKRERRKEKGERRNKKRETRNKKQETHTRSLSLDMYVGRGLGCSRRWCD